VVEVVVVAVSHVTSAAGRHVSCTESKRVSPTQSYGMLARLPALHQKYLVQSDEGDHPLSSGGHMCSGSEAAEVVL
jgi:hypothetical protein